MMGMMDDPSMMGMMMQMMMAMNQGMMDDMESMTPADESAPFDARFIDSMIEHHQGAIEMATEAQSQAEHEEIKQLADAIIAAQQAEIEQLREWRTEWYPDLPATQGMGDMQMTGDMGMMYGMMPTQGMMTMMGMMQMMSQMQTMMANCPMHSTSTTPAETPATTPAPSLDAADMTREAQAGAITVKATLLNMADTAAESLDFQIVLETHSVDLTFDLATMTVLRAGEEELAPISWTPSAANGHHVTGTLSFPATTADGASLHTEVPEVTMVISGLPNAEDVSFTWELIDH
jgi:hypothetical protein